MPTIHDELAGLPGPASWFTTLRALGIDPDLPAEWATVDRCLAWLDERGYVASSGPGPFCGSEVTVGADFQAPRAYIESTLHAALIAACKAVQEAS